MSLTKKILVLHGPNLNMLGKREPDIYGQQSLADIDNALGALGEHHGIGVDTFQSNAEHEIIERIHATFESSIAFIVINPAAFTHTSVAIRDALLAVDIPFIEVHLSNVYQREGFRKHSYFSDAAVAVISGCGAQSYTYALSHAIKQLQNEDG